MSIPESPDPSHGSKTDNEISSFIRKYIDAELKSLENLIQEKQKEDKDDNEILKNKIKSEVITANQAIAILGIIIASAITFFSNLYSRIDTSNGRIDYFSRQVNEIHQILKDQSQESRQTKTNGTTKIQSQSKIPQD